jgi:hypothetical protein
VTRIRTRAAVAAAVILPAVAAACGSGAQTSNALYSSPRPWGVGKTIDPVGQLWSVGGIPLCTKGHSPVTITSITPVVIRGQIHLSRIAIRRVQRRSTIGTYPGLPPGSKQPAGYVIPSPSPCGWPTAIDPIYETVIAASRTGARGGYIEGLRVRYRVGSARGEYVIPFTYALCGRDGPGTCRPT